VRKEDSVGRKRAGGIGGVGDWPGGGALETESKMWELDECLQPLDVRNIGAA
jgi:hypothetical protein